MLRNMLVFNALRYLTATLYNVIRGCCALVLCMKIFTRDHACDHRDIYNNISCNIVYLQLDIVCRKIVYIAAALRMACCNVLRGCFFIHSVNYK